MILNLCASLLIVAGTLPQEHFTRAASAEEVARGDEVAKAVMKRLGNDAYDLLQHLTFDFVVVEKGATVRTRTHHWDKARGVDRVVAHRDGQDIDAVVNLSDQSGDVWVNGKPVTDAATKNDLLAKAYAWWINDSYWLVSPYKLLDPGVKRAVIDGNLRTTFDGVGLTPGDAYIYHLDAEGLPKTWSWLLQSGERGDFTYAEPVKLMGAAFWRKKISDGFSIYHNRIEVFTERRPERMQPGGAS